VYKRNKAPVETNDIIELHVQTLNHVGEGVGRLEGFAVFVPGALPGELVRAKVVRSHKNFARALPESIIEVSPHRIKPLCEQSGICGGCQLQHLAYSEQLRFKQKAVEDALLRLGGLADAPLRPIIGMDEPWRYRNKALVPLGVVGNEITAGFYERSSHSIVALESCYLQHTANEQVIRAISRILGELNISVYDKERGEGLVRYVSTRVSFSSGDLVVVLGTGSGSFPRKDEFVTALRQAVPGVRGILQRIDVRGDNAKNWTEPEELVLWGESRLRESLGGLRFDMSPRSFFQVNPSQTEILYDTALEYAGLTGDETVFDLYCGIGTISLYLARRSGRVVGVETEAASVRDAKENAELNGINNADFYEGSAEKIVPNLYKYGTKADIVVVDPPRKGCDYTLLGVIAAMKPKKIVYISCNPATLARDLKVLRQKGYDIREIQPVDMFPQTAHIECVCLLTPLA